MMIAKVCAPRQLLLQISQKGLVLIADIFTVERERERKILMKNFLIYLIIKWMNNNRQIVKTLLEGATDLLEM